MATRKPDAGQLRKFRSEVAKLKSKGLTSKRVDARSQRPTRYMRAQVEKYRDVLEGTAKVVSTPKRKQAKSFADKFRVKGNKVVIPVSDEKTIIRYSRKTNEFTASRKVAGKRVTTKFKGGSLDDINRLPKGYLYTIRFDNGQVYRFDTKSDLIAFMHPYEVKPRNPFRNWRKYVELERVEDAEE